MREELSYRTIMMNEEMEKWRQQSLLTSTAVMEAKNEVGCFRGKVYKNACNINEGFSFQKA